MNYMQSKRQEMHGGGAATAQAIERFDDEIDQAVARMERLADGLQGAARHLLYDVLRARSGVPFSSREPELQGSAEQLWRRALARQGCR